MAAIPPAMLSFLGLGAATASHAHAAANPGFTEFPLTSGDDRPLEIALGPDGNLWFTELTGPNIGRITTAGTITEFPVPANGSFLQTGGMVAGPDGNMWFTDTGNNSIGQITMAGVITEFAIPTANTGTRFITLGPDGNLWFTENNTDKVGRITTSGTITEYSISAGSGVQFITSGPDGNLWFTEQSIDKVGRITPTGTLSEFAMASGSQPWGIVAAPDGNMWITENGTSNIANMSMSGTVLNQYSVLTPNAGLAGIKVGPNGNLWFAEFGGSNEIGEVTTGGAITEFPLGTSSGAFDLAIGADGNVWYTGFFGPTIGRFWTNPNIPCASLADSSPATPVGPGSSVSISVTLTSCGAAPMNTSTTTTTTAVPSGCPAAPLIPSFTTSSLTYGQTDPHSTTFAAPSCAGTYAVTSETTTGSTVVATAQASYTVLAVGGGALYPTNTGRYPTYITAGSDGNLWWTDGNINRITPSGTVTPFPGILPGGAGQIVGGTDGSLYVVVRGSSDGVAQVKINGCCGPSFAWQVPASAGTTINDLVPGVDGNMWFTAGSSSHGIVGFVTPGAKFKRFNLPAGSGVPFSMTAGPDDAMWFTLDSGQVGRITTAGAVTLVPMPAGESSGGIALGPDGNFWMTVGPHTGNGITPNYVLRMTPSGAFTQFATPTPDVGAGSITTGADGNLWFNEPWLGNTPECPNKVGSGGVGRITTTGVITEFGAGCSDSDDSFDIVAGPDGNVWNAAYYHDAIDMIEIGAPSTCTPLSASATPTMVPRGTTETTTATIANCATSEQLMKLTSKTTSTCGPSTTTKQSVPLQPRVKTVLSNSFAAPKCRGTYAEKLTLSAGGSVLATKTVRYQVT